MVPCAYRDQKLVAKVCPTPSAHKAIKRVTSESSVPSRRSQDHWGQILWRPDRENTQRGQGSPPHFPKSRHSWKNKHFNAGYTMGPTAHSRHTEASPSPFLRENHTVHTALAAAQGCSGLRAVTYWFSSLLAA